MTQHCTAPLTMERLNNDDNEVIARDVTMNACMRANLMFLIVQLGHCVDDGGWERAL